MNVNTNDADAINLVALNVRSFRTDVLINLLADAAERGGLRNDPHSLSPETWQTIAALYRAELVSRGVEFCAYDGAVAVATSGDIFVCSGHADMRVDRPL